MQDGAATRKYKHTLAIVDNASMNKGVKSLFEILISILLSIYLEQDCWIIW